MTTTVSRKASQLNAATSPNTGFAAHFVRQNALHFAKPYNVMPLKCCDIQERRNCPYEVAKIYYHRCDSDDITRLS